MTDPDPISRILERDLRYPRGAYEFVREVLGLTTHPDGAPRHVTAKELLESLRDHVRAQFGPLSRTVLEDWNVRNTADFGNIVWNLVDEGAAGKTDEDKLTDFIEVFDFTEAFPPDLGDVAFAEPDEDE